MGKRNSYQSAKEKLFFKQTLFFKQIHFDRMLENGVNVKHWKDVKIGLCGFGEDWG
jgi:hypothetical protein